MGGFAEMAAGMASRFDALPAADIAKNSAAAAGKAAADNAGNVAKKSTAPASSHISVDSTGKQLLDNGLIRPEHGENPAAPADAAAGKTVDTPPAKPAQESPGTLAAEGPKSSPTDADKQVAADAAKREQTEKNEREKLLQQDNITLADLEKNTLDAKSKLTAVEENLLNPNLSADAKQLLEENKSELTKELEDFSNNTKKISEKRDALAAQVTKDKGTAPTEPQKTAGDEFADLPHTKNPDAKGTETPADAAAAEPKRTPQQNKDDLAAETDRNTALKMMLSKAKEKLAETDEQLKLTPGVEKLTDDKKKFEGQIASRTAKIEASDKKVAELEAQVKKDSGIMGHVMRHSNEYIMGASFVLPVALPWAYQKLKSGFGGNGNSNGAAPGGGAGSVATSAGSDAPLFNPYNGEPNT